MEPIGLAAGYVNTNKGAYAEIILLLILIISTNIWQWYRDRK